MITFTVDVNEETVDGFYWLLSFDGESINYRDADLPDNINLVDGMRIRLEQDNVVLFEAILHNGYVPERRAVLWYAVPDWETKSY